MQTLAFSTSSCLSVALLSEQKILSKNIVYENNKQSELLIFEIEKTLTQNKIWYEDLDLIAATNGPASFTASRIGLSVARTLKIATNLPLILVNSCEAIAYKYRYKSGKIFTVIDASMDEFFCAEFFSKNQKIEQVTEPFLARVEELLEILPKTNFFLCGSGKKIAAEILQKQNRSFEMEEGKDEVTAELVGLLAYERFQENFETTENLEPIYLRSPRIEKRKK